MKICVVDLETSISPGVHGSQAKDPSNDFYTLIYGFHPDNIQVVHKPEGFKRRLEEYKERLITSDIIVGHIMPFDLSYLTLLCYNRCKHGKLVWDCQVAEFLMSGQRHAYASLAELQEIYLGMKVKEDRISKLFKRGIGADKILAARYRCRRVFKLYDQYCHDDGSTTLLIFKKQYERAKRMNMLALIWMYQRFMIVLTIMMQEGIKVDLTNTEKTKQRFKLKSLDILEQASTLIKQLWNDPRLPAFNILSPTHKSALLFGGHIKCKVVHQLGFYKDKKVFDGTYRWDARGRKRKYYTIVKGRPKTKTVEENVFVPGFQLNPSFTYASKVEGRWSTDAKVIHKIATTSTNALAVNYCNLQIRAMHYEKMVSTYLDPFLKYSINGFLYPHFNNTAVITARLSSSAPNLQNCPSKGEFVLDIQGQLIAPEGFICVSADFSQLEMWIAAWNSGDEQLIHDLINGLDFHCQSLAFAEQMKYEEVYDLCHKAKDPVWCLKRTKAKAITFQKEYGAGFKKVAEETGLSVEIVQRVFNALDEKYWKLKLFKEHVLKTAQHNMKPSFIKNVPTMQRKGGVNGRRFNRNGFELLPVLNGTTKYYDNDLIRQVGYYQTKHGKIYSFEEYADLDRNGGIRRSLSVPQTKNYTSQGGAADVMAAISIELMQYCLDNYDNVRYISQIHDSCWLYVREEKKDLILPKICDIMENVPYALKKHLNVNLNYNFPIEMKIGKNFAEMEVYER